MILAPGELILLNRISISTSRTFLLLILDSRLALKLDISWKERNNPKCFRKGKQKQSRVIFGTDYPTADDAYALDYVKVALAR